jgi:hypothetical protein
VHLSVKAQFILLLAFVMDRRPVSGHFRERITIVYHHWLNAKMPCSKVISKVGKQLESRLKDLNFVATGAV